MTMLKKLSAIWMVAVLAGAWVAHASPIIVDVAVYDNGGTAWEIDSALPPSGGGSPFGSLGATQQPDAYGSNPTPNSGINNASEFSAGPTTGGGTYDDRVHVDGGNLSVNVVNLGYNALTFQFYSNGAYTPTTLSAYLQTEDGVSWYYDLTVPAAASGWTYYGQSFNELGWYAPYAGLYGASALSAFQSALNGTLAEVGIRLYYADPYASTQEYGLRDYAFGTQVPEPGTYMMLSTALMSLGYTFARRRRAEKKA